MNRAATPEAPGNGHPTIETLTHFIRGQTDDVDANGIENHLGQCDSCCSLLLKISSSDDDQFLHRLRTAADSSNHALADAHSGSRKGITAGLPKRVGRFEIRDEIGRGGFGVVLLAVDSTLRREVALKIPNQGSLLAPEMRERFLRESQAAAALDHPNIVSVHEAGEDDHVCFIASSYCRGPNLAHWLKDRQGPMATQTAAGLVADLAAAVQHAHLRGVLHRDLKPSNVMLEPDGASEADTASSHRSETSKRVATPDPSFAFIPKITDFGLAKLDGEHEHVTLSNVVVGTAAYMSPEQASGRAKNVGPATDVYSLGAILYELLTGRPPIVGESELETLQRVQTEDPIPPTRLRPKLPRDLETICLTCLRKDQRRRYDSADALADDLHRYLRGEPIKARRTGRVDKFRRWCRRNPSLAILSSCVVLLLAALLSILLLSRTRLSEQLAETRAAEESSRRALYDSWVSEGLEIQRTRQIGQRERSLRVLGQAAESADQLDSAEKLRLRNAVVASLALTDLQVDRRWPGYPPGTAGTGAAFDRKVERFAMIDTDGHLVVKRFSDNSELVRIDVHPPPQRPPDWRLLLRLSPDRQLIAAADASSVGGPIGVWDAVKGGKRFSIPLQATKATCDFSRDRLAVAHFAKKVTLHNSNDGSLLATWPVAADLLRFDPSGRRIATALASNVRILDVESGNTLSTFSTAADVQSLAWSADGRLLATGEKDLSARVWDVQSASLRSVCGGHMSGVVNVAFHPDGDILATYSWDRSTRLWEIGTGRLLLTAPGAGDSFSDDGKWLAFGFSGSHVGRWKVTRSKVRRVLANRFANVLNMDLDPRGRVLLVCQPDRISFWDIETLTEIGVVQLGDQRKPILGALFHPRMDLVVTQSIAGLHRWPLVRQGQEAVQIGPPQRIELGHTESRPSHMWCGRDGRLLLNFGREIAVVDLGDEPAPVLRIRHSENRHLQQVSGSADGKWLTSSTWQGYKATIFDGRTGRRVYEYPGRNLRVTFGSDPRFLALTSQDGCSIRRAGTWEPVAELAQAGTIAPVFSADGQFLALERRPGVVSLVEAGSMRELVSLTAPSRDNLASILFTPDGNRILARSATGVISIWDLSQVRRRLRHFGLDWDKSVLPAPQDTKSTTPLQLTLVRGEFEFLEANYQKLAHDTENGDLYYERGMTHMQLQQWKKAANCFRVALLKNGKDARALCRRAEARYKMRLHKEALEDFNRSIALDGEKAEAYYGRAQAHAVLNDKKKAVEDWQRAVNLSPGNWRWYFQLGLAREVVGQHDEAVSAFTWAASAASHAFDRSLVLKHRALARQRQGKLAEALADSETALALDPENNQRQNELAWLLVVRPTDRDSAKRAAELAEQAIGPNLFYSEAWHTLGVARFRLGEYAKARTAIKETTRLTSNPDSYDYFFLAMIEWRLGNQVEARRLLGLAKQWMLERDPENRELKMFRKEAEDLITAK